MKLFDGLFLYEIVLLLLGVVMFLILLFILVYFVINKRSLKILTLYFPIPIIMIAYPSIQSIQFGNGIAVTIGSTQRVQANPGDKQAAEKLRADVAKIERRPITNPSTYLVLARAHEVLGDTAQSVQYADSILAGQTVSPESGDYKIRVDAARIRANHNVNLILHNSKDTVARNTLQADLGILSAAREPDAFRYYTIARAHAALGDSVKSKTFMHQALLLNPNLGQEIQHVPGRGF